MTRARRWFPAALVASVAVCLAGGLRADDPALKFEKFTSKEGKYSVLLPGKPKMMTQEEESPLRGGGKLKIHMAVVAVNKDPLYLVIYNDYPEQVGKAPPQDVLKAVRDGIAKKDGKVLDDKETTLGKDKHPGRVFLMQRQEGDKTMYYRAAVYLVGTRLYHLAVASSDKAAVTGKDAQKFYDSFEIEK